MRVQAQRLGEGESRELRVARAAVDFAERAQRAEMPRLERERAVQGDEARGVVAGEVVKGRLLVPGLGPVRAMAHERSEPRLGDFVAASSKIARSEVERALGFLAPVIHPGAPDLLLDAFGGLRLAAGGKRVKKPSQARR